jgi:hypothetical protein
MRNDLHNILPLLQDVPDIQEASLHLSNPMARTQATHPLPREDNDRRKDRKVPMANLRSLVRIP